MKDIMAWMMLVGVVVAFECATMIEASLQTFDIEPNLQKTVITEDANTEDDYKPAELLEELRLQRLGQHLTEILLHPDQGVPIVYVEEYPTVAAASEATEGNEYSNQFPDVQRQVNPEVNEIPFKRSRYYRKYPWKRQNSREACCDELSTPAQYTNYQYKFLNPMVSHFQKKGHVRSGRYDAENRYLCQPSREDVFRLLVALHEARQGNSRTVNFCNRRRSATAVFTNIRFLGRRK